MYERVSKVIERWFLSEPALFGIMCLHDIVENDAISCPFRCGMRRVEYNTSKLDDMSDVALEEALRAEAVRLLLKHPYERRPEACCDQAIFIGSNLVIGDQYEHSDLNIEKPKDFGLEENRPYEWYARKMQELMDREEADNGQSGKNDKTDDSKKDSQGQSEEDNSSEKEKEKDKDNDKGEDKGDGEGDGEEENGGGGDGEGDGEGEGEGKGNGEGEECGGGGGDGDGDSNGDGEGEGKGKGNGKGNGDGGNAEENGGGSGGEMNEGDSWGNLEGKDNANPENCDRTELWMEDDLMTAEVNEYITNTQHWGSLGGQFAEMLKASTNVKINWRRVLAGFRASILSSKRKLTRMRPNRRTGFENMGSTFQYETRLLIAVDTSASISDAALSYFFGAINSAFKYGMTSVDVIQFDCGITNVCRLNKKINVVRAFGRGGTSFQEPVNYANDNHYDGLAIFTDGYAPEPTMPKNMRYKIIWVCQDDMSYNTNHVWMEKSGRVCTINVI